MTLVEFLLARITEDEEVARQAADGGRWHYEDGDSVGAWTLYDEHWAIGSLKTYRHDDYDYGSRMPAVRHPRYVDADANGRHIAAWDPARVLAECEAKRAIIRQYDIACDAEYGDIAAAIRAEQDFYFAMKCLAVPHADHPDYREEWRP